MAGMAAAHYLNKSGLDWTLFEQGDRLGGKVVTDRTDGFLIEGGPDSFITQKPWGLELCRELGLDDELIPCNTAKQKVYILVKGRLCALPEGFRLTVPTRIWPFITSPLFSWPAKMRMTVEPFIPAKRDDEDESISDFITRRLGREAADKIGGPLMAGIYVADPARLSLLSTFPQFRAMEKKYGSLIRAMRAAAKRPASGMPMFMSLRDGMGRLIEALVEPIRDKCLTSIGITAIKRTGDKFALAVGGSRSRVTGDTQKRVPPGEAFDALILATPLYQAAELMQDMIPQAANALREIRYVSTATVSLGFKLPLKGVDQALDGFGFVVPASEKRNLLACTWSSVKFEGRAPQGHVLMRAFVGGEGREEMVDWTDDRLIEVVRGELRSIMDIHDDPVIARVFRWPQGNPQYDVGHADRMKAFMGQIAQVPGLHVAGSGYNGIGLPDCIRSGKEAAEAVVRELGTA